MSPTEGRRGYSIIAAFVIASIALTTIYYREGDDGPLHKAQSWGIGVVAPVQSAVSRIFEPIAGFYYFVMNIGGMRSDNESLKKENSELKSKLRSLSNLEAENKRLRSIIGFERRYELKGLPAKVVSWQSNNWQSTVVIDLGSDDGVQKGMPVVTGEGLIGQVIQTSAHASRVLLIIDQKSGVSVQLGGSGDVGVLHGQSDGSLLVSYISKETTIAAGETVVTSGLGGVFPKGIYVGKTADVGKVGYNLYKAVKIVSPVDFRRLEEVLVVTNAPAKTPFGE